MAHLHRVALTLLFCLPMFLAGHEAHAYPATRTNPDACTVAPCFEYSTRSWSNSAIQEPYLPTKEAACDRALAEAKAANSSATGTGNDFDPNFYIVSISGGNLCYIRDSRDAFPNWSWTIGSRSLSPATPTYSCPAGGTLSGTNCVCPEGQTDTGTSCSEPPPVNNCADYTGGKTEISGRGGLGAKTVCISAGAPFNSGDPASAGCVLTAQADFAAVVDKNIGFEWVAQGTFTGGKCDPATFEEEGTAPVGAADPSADKQTAPTKCSPGQYPGSVNGVEVCVDPVGGDATQKQTQKGDTTNNPDGSTTQTQQTQQTTCEGSACTTTTTTTVTTTPAGGGASTTETTTSVGTCTRGSPGCGDEERDRSSFGGSCSAFACDGDAIMCAVALEQHRRNCQLYGDSPESQLYDTEKGKTGPQYTSETVNLGPGSFSQVNALGAGAQCISDKTITVAGNTISLPFSQICSTLQHLGTVLLFIAFLTAYRIVSGR